MDPITLALISAGVSAAGSAVGGILGKKKETGTQKKQRALVDDLLASLKGQGSYNDLFSADEAAFQKGFVEPAQSRFRNQTAPAIQQQYIASGQQRGTGLDDTLARAGVDMDQLLNEHYAQFQQGAQNRQVGAINSILGYGGQGPQSTGDAAKQGVAGYLSGSGFGSDISGILGAVSNKPPKGANSLTDTYKPQRKGFEKEDQYYDPYTGVME